MSFVHNNEHKNLNAFQIVISINSHTLPLFKILNKFFNNNQIWLSLGFTKTSSVLPIKSQFSERIYMPPMLKISVGSQGVYRKLIGWAMRKNWETSWVWVLLMAPFPKTFNHTAFNVDLWNQYSIVFLRLCFTVGQITMGHVKLFVPYS